MGLSELLLEEEGSGVVSGEGVGEQSVLVEVSGEGDVGCLAGGHGADEGVRGGLSGADGVARLAVGGEPVPVLGGHGDGAP